MNVDNESSLRKLFLESSLNDNVFMIATTVDTGFEWQAIDECKEKLDKNVKVVKERGKIYFNIYWNQFVQIQEMRSIDNMFIVADVSKFEFSGNSKEMDLQLFKNAVHNNMKLEKTLDIWKHITGFQGKIYPTIDEYNLAEKDRKLCNTTVAPTTPKGKKRGQNPSNAKEDEILRYRVTCERTGKHIFESSDVARTIGGELQDKYLWLVDLSTYYLEIVCKLINNELVTQLRVTHESKHHRNIMCFGPTTLRATICYNLLRLAHPKPGDIIIDPMCGSGSIPIEATLVYFKSYVIGGDNHPKAVHRTKSNIEASSSKCKIDLIHWNVSQLPFKDSFIDIAVTDMPFGKRSGRIMDNRILYKQFLIELGRIIKLLTGRIVLLTYDRRSFNMALQAAGDLFYVTKTLGINIGGLQAAVYVLKRTNIPYEQFKPKSVKNMTYKKK
ncbi:THUMP domain-containing protein 3-like isoform X1 [Apis laboriosa]|uniref:THUMP domain-containing protein 3-like isoform X1 n=1 Tax=Apis laboriosa TaxID=183418 RepID=UPI001CC5C88A|nr:THUMP domain-containing protein 3-like isoform X1 [Apis laboriosa]XP_043802980.1 THUMP domain-containing protein 3-like isoform X1 [Apis laboriosa]XP_043802981.1 THUMP domain-containing protein 3-like isoform X1 [Apis laboriosa]